MGINTEVLPVLIVALLTWGGVFLYLLRLEKSVREAERRLEQLVNEVEHRLTTLPREDIAAVDAES